MSKNIVITGANRGIGLALVNCFKHQGDTVYALCRDSSVELDALSVNLITGVDVVSDEGIATMAGALEQVNIDVLICNAGILHRESLGEIDCTTIRQQFEVNALAPLRVVDALTGQLSAGAKVALITSRMGSVTDNDSGGFYGYRMSKAALNAAAMSLAKDLAADNIAVGIYHPGFVQTGMVNHKGDISAMTSAERLTGLINALTMAQTGVFKHSNGEILPW